MKVHQMSASAAGFSLFQLMRADDVQINIEVQPRHGLTYQRVTAPIGAGTPHQFTIYDLSQAILRLLFDLLSVRMDTFRRITPPVHFQRTGGAISQSRYSEPERQWRKA